MNFIKKYCITILFTITASLTAGSVGAQAWIAAYYGETSYGIPINMCSSNAAGTKDGGYPTDPSGISGTYNCECPQGWTNGYGTETNCDYDGAVRGCWNPVGVPKGSTVGTGACTECGKGGTIGMLLMSCFGGINGQQNLGTGHTQTPTGSAGGKGVSCTQNSDCQGYNALCTGTNASGECISWGTVPTSGGFSTN